MSICLISNKQTIVSWCAKNKIVN